MTPEETLKLTTEYLKNLQAMKTHYVAVGLPAGKVENKTNDDGTSIIEIGAAHEFGAEIDHPGGTGYMATGVRLRSPARPSWGRLAALRQPTRSHSLNVPFFALHSPSKSRKLTGQSKRLVRP